MRLSVAGYVFVRISSRVSPKKVSSLPGKPIQILAVYILPMTLISSLLLETSLGTSSLVVKAKTLINASRI